MLREKIEAFPILLLVDGCREILPQDRFQDDSARVPYRRFQQRVIGRIRVHVNEKYIQKKRAFAQVLVLYSGIGVYQIGCQSGY